MLENFSDRLKNMRNVLCSVNRTCNTTSISIFLHSFNILLYLSFFSRFSLYFVDKHNLFFVNYFLLIFLLQLFSSNIFCFVLTVYLVFYTLLLLSPSSSLEWLMLLFDPIESNRNESHKQVASVVPFSPNSNIYFLSYFACLLFYYIVNCLQLSLSKLNSIGMLLLFINLVYSCSFYLIKWVLIKCAFKLIYIFYFDLSFFSSQLHLLYSSFFIFSFPC